MVSTDSTTKRCTKCGEEKPANTIYFAARKANRSGLSCWCRECYRRRAEDSRRAKGKLPVKRVKDDGLYRQCSVCNEWKPANTEFYTPDKRRPRGIAASCRECNNARLLAYYYNDPEVKIYRRHRRSILRASSGNYTKTDVELQYKSQRGLCWHCGKALNGEYHIDHLHPVSKGGTSNPSNIVISCAWCNHSKGSKLVHEWNGRLL